MIILFACIECREVFEEPIYWEETHGLDTPPYERWSGCPYCKGSYVELYKCSCCDEWIITDGYVKTEDDKRYCNDCFCVLDLGDE
jgi:hypothetical protein